ncbi:cobalamin biosynthesis protein CbiX [Cryobacterium algoricola]|uniref:Cobalamin biosynthesis protein CbiX n=1 Tax=Cryobacterium algoricola TaxID=1259183 RepID=A0ABY2IIR1_9MICO|nr:cobalamin biosynthesis protein CbiX [Cryobacterium algoricola]
MALTVRIPSRPEQDSARGRTPSDPIGQARTHPPVQNRGVTASTSPALVGIAHGTSSAAGQAAVAGLMAAVALAEPTLHTALGYVDVQQPDAPSTLAALPAGVPAVVVPLLLSAGYHVYVDLTDAVAGEAAASARSVTMTEALGPDDRLIELLRERLDEVPLNADDSLVLAVAGSSDARAVAACRVVAERLSLAAGRDVALGFLSAARPRLACAVTIERIQRPGRRVVVSSYLLAPGFFQGLVEKAGADAVTAPLLLPTEPASPLLVAVVTDRYRNALTPTD